MHSYPPIFPRRASLAFSLALASLALTVHAAAPAGMVLIHAKDQSFMMGLDKSEYSGGDPWAHYENKHKVTFTYDFYMDTAMVTQGEYKAVTGLNPSGHNTGDMKLPVDKVTWFDAVIYLNARSKREGLDTVYTYTSLAKSGNAVNKLNGLAYDIKKSGYRIPTNAEYEYAERAGTTGKYYFAPDGKDVNALGAQVAWYTGNSGGASHPVATKKPNPWGLYDMTGNLFEWCNDWDAAYPTHEEIDPIGGAGTNKVAKGGSFKTDIAGHMRIQYHWKWGPGDLAVRSDFGNVGEVGFRAVRTATGAVGIGTGKRGANGASGDRGNGGYSWTNGLSPIGGSHAAYDLGGRWNQRSGRKILIVPLGK